MKQYRLLLKHVLDHGAYKADRTGTGTLSVFGYQMRFDLSNQFPLLTTKRLHIRSIVYELLWFLRGDTNIQYLNDHGVHIWDAWADENGDLGPVYGAQWRRWQVKRITGSPSNDQANQTIDQLSQVIDQIKTNPNSRRLIVSAWNVGEIQKMALPPCHVLFQFYVVDGRLSCQLYQRSADVFLGLPFNIASYALLTSMVAQVCDLKRGELAVSTGDTHLYMDHLALARLQLKRRPRQLPVLILNPSVRSIFDYKYGDIQIADYNPYPHIRAAVSV